MSGWFSTLLGWGRATLDYITVVPRFPLPNQKLRAEYMDVQGSLGEKRFAAQGRTA